VGQPQRRTVPATQSAECTGRRRGPLRGPSDDANAVGRSRTPSKSPEQSECIVCTGSSRLVTHRDAPLGATTARLSCSSLSTEAQDNKDGCPRSHYVIALVAVRTSGSGRVRVTSPTLVPAPSVSWRLWWRPCVPPRTADGDWGRSPVLCSTQRLRNEASRRSRSHGAA
jgi:hypothetical protein